MQVKRAATLLSTPQTNPPTPANRRGGASEKKCRSGASHGGPIVFFKAPAWHCCQRWKPAETVSAMGLCRGAAWLSRLRRGSSYFSKGVRRLCPAVPPWSWKPAETVRSLGFCRGAARLSRLRPGSTSCFSIGGSEGYVRHCRLGAGSPLKRSVP